MPTRTSCGGESTWPCCPAHRTARSLQPGGKAGADLAGREPWGRLRRLTRATANHLRRSDRTFPTLTRPWGGSEGEECGEQPGAALVAEGQPAVAGQPGQGALDDPAVPAQPGRGLDAAAGDPRGDP